MTPRGFTRNVNGQTVYRGYVVVGVEVAAEQLTSNVFGALTVDGSQPDCQAGIRLKTGSALFITETSNIAAMTCEGNRQSNTIFQQYAVEPAFKVLITLALDALTSDRWTGILRVLFRQELSADLEINVLDYQRIQILSATEQPAGRRLLGLEVGMEIYSHSAEDAENIRRLAELVGFTPAASRSGINGGVRMLSLSVSGPPTTGLEGSDGSPVNLPVNGSNNSVTIIDTPFSPDDTGTTTTIGVTIALASAAGMLVLMACGTFHVRRYYRSKKHKKKASDIKAFRNLLDLSRGNVRDEVYSNQTAEARSLQTVTCSLEYGDSFDDEDDFLTDDEGSELATFEDFSSGEESERRSSAQSIDTWDGDDLQSNLGSNTSRSTMSLGSIREGAVDVPPIKMPRGIKRKVYRSRPGTPTSSSLANTPRSGPSPRGPRAIASIHEHGGRLVIPIGTELPPETMHSIPFLETVTATPRAGVSVEASIVTGPTAPKRIKGYREVPLKHTRTPTRLGREAPADAGAARSAGVGTPYRNRTKVQIPDDTSSDSGSAISLTLGSGGHNTGTHSPGHSPGTGSGTHTPVRHTDSLNTSSNNTPPTRVDSGIPSGVAKKRTPARVDSGISRSSGISSIHSSTSGSETGTSSGVHLTLGSGTHTASGSGTHSEMGDDDELLEMHMAGTAWTPRIPTFSTQSRTGGIRFAAASPAADVQLTSTAQFMDASYQEDETDEDNGSEVESCVLDLHIEDASTPTPRSGATGGSGGVAPHTTPATRMVDRRLSHKSRVHKQMQGSPGTNMTPSPAQRRSRRQIEVGREVEQVSVPLVHSPSNGTPSKTPSEGSSASGGLQQFNVGGGAVAASSRISSMSGLAPSRDDSRVSSSVSGSSGEVQQFSLPLTPTSQRPPDSGSLLTTPGGTLKQFTVPLTPQTPQAGMYHPASAPVGQQHHQARSLVERREVDLHIEETSSQALTSARSGDSKSASRKSGSPTGRRQFNVALSEASEVDLHVEEVSSQGQSSGQTSGQTSGHASGQTSGQTSERSHRSSSSLKGRRQFGVALSEASDIDLHIEETSSKGQNSDRSSSQGQYSVSLSEAVSPGGSVAGSAARSLRQAMVSEKAAGSSAAAGVTSIKSGASGSAPAVTVTPRTQEANIEAITIEAALLEEE